MPTSALNAGWSGRMKLLDISATGEENIIEAESGDRMNDLDYRRRQLETMQTTVIDLEDLFVGRLHRRSDAQRSAARSGARAHR